MNVRLFLFCILSIVFSSCEEEKPISVKGPNLLIRLKASGNLPRLDNTGSNSVPAPGNAAVTPTIQQLGLHYIELLPNANTQFGQGEIVYSGEETNFSGPLAIDFSKCKVDDLGIVYLSIPIDEITPGTYFYPRVMLAYQNIELPVVFNGADLKARVAGFVGYNTYIKEYRLDDEVVSLNDDKLQGYWGLEVNFSGFSTVFEGQSPPYLTTSVNPLYATSPVPAGACYLTAELAEPIVITGNETKDINLELTFSTNQSFEWKEINMDGKFDPNLGEWPVDMGLRGMAARIY